MMAIVARSCALFNVLKMINGKETDFSFSIIVSMVYFQSGYVHGSTSLLISQQLSKMSMPKKYAAPKIDERVNSQIQLLPKSN